MATDLHALLDATNQLHREQNYSPIAATASLARHLDTAGLLDTHPLLESADRLAPRSALVLPAAGIPPDVLGLAYEGLIDAEQRRSTGAHFTPPDLASKLVELALEDWVLDRSVTVCDPAVGSGAFLLAAARSLHSRGFARDEIVASWLYGSDVNGEALLVADASLTLWSGGTRPSGHLVEGDAVGGRPFDESFDLVVGNPPFQSQLATATARSRTDARILQERFGEAALGYVDSAALFLLASLDLVAPRGRLMMLQPQSTLAAGDAETIRRTLVDRGDLKAVWLGGRDTFAAEVEVCALLVEFCAAEPTPIRVLTGSDLDPAASHAPSVLAEASTWSLLLASASGVPAADLAGAGTLRDMCTATAGFRDQFYGLAPFTHELEEHAHGEQLPRLVTVGMIDPARSRWGTAEFRFNKQHWTRPVVDVDTLEKADTALGTWARERLAPKVCVATQTKVIEAAVDSGGNWLPATPVIAVAPDPDDLWRVAAVLSAPPVSAWAMRSHAGAALSSDALRLSARQVLDLPLPANRERWNAGAACVEAATRAGQSGDLDGRQVHLLALGEQMCAAYEVADDGLLAWWEGRLPPQR